MGLSKDDFYDERNIAIIPMAFCFPGYDEKGSDLPPPKICAATWRSSILENFQNLELKLLVGSFAQKWHLDTNLTVTNVVKDWRLYALSSYLSHTLLGEIELAKEKFRFEKELVPVLRNKVRGILKMKQLNKAFWKCRGIQKIMTPVSIIMECLRIQIYFCYLSKNLATKYLSPNLSSLRAKLCSSI